METIGALWKHGLLSEDLLFGWLWVSDVWERVQGLALAQRQGTCGSTSRRWLRRRNDGTKPTRPDAAAHHYAQRESTPDPLEIRSR